MDPQVGASDNSLQAISRYLERPRSEIRARAVQAELDWLEMTGAPSEVVTERLQSLAELLPDEPDEPSPYY